jgi:hypothetical protein
MVHEGKPRLNIHELYCSLKRNQEAFELLIITHTSKNLIIAHSRYQRMSSLPKSIEAACKAYAGDSQHPWEASSVTPSPPKYSDAHLARSRSSSPELNASSPPSSPQEESQLDCPRSDSLGKSLNTSSSPSGTECLEPGEVWAADYLPPGWKVLPKCCYNYELFEPPPPPPVLPCSRAWLYSQIVSTSRSVFLSCNLTNPIHLASIIGFGGKWSFMEEVADHMVPAGYYEYVEEPPA